MKTVLKTILSLFIIGLVIRSIDSRLLLQVMGEARWSGLIWAAAWFVLSKFIGAYRYNELLETEGIRLPFRQQLRLYWLGMYYNLLLPGGISGDGYKIKKLRDDTGRPLRRLFSITLFDRVSGMLALGQICLVLAWWLPALAPYRWCWALGLTLSIPVSKILFDRMIGVNRNLWVATSVQSLGVQLGQLISTFGIVFALQQQDQWLGYSLVFLVSSVVAMLPLTIGGAGARELTFLWGARVLGLDSERSVAIAFLFYLISTSVALYGLLYSFNPKPLQPATPA